MKEVGYKSDSPGAGPKPSMPKDAKLIGVTCGYEIYISLSTEQIIVQTKDYHPGDLYISKSELEDMLGKL
jgi:hypothetical protein